MIIHIATGDVKNEIDSVILGDRYNVIALAFLSMVNKSGYHSSQLFTTNQWFRNLANSRPLKILLLIFKVEIALHIKLMNMKPKWNR